jgi:hypothetical protein
MAGGAVASIAVGRTVGVAPEADLYCIATHRGDNGSDDTYLADTIRRIVTINKALPRERKIRVISMSIGWGLEVEGHPQLMAAVRGARAAGMLVVSTTIQEMYGLDLGGLGRPPLADPNTAASYEPGAFWTQAFANSVWRDTYGVMLLVPRDSRATASHSGVDEHAFYRAGGMSWAVPSLRQVAWCTPVSGAHPSPLGLHAPGDQRQVNVAQHHRRFRITPRARARLPLRADPVMPVPDGLIQSHRLRRAVRVDHAGVDEPRGGALLQQVARCRDYR